MMSDIELWIMITVSMTLAVTLFASLIILARKSGRRDHDVFLAIFIGFYALVKLDHLFLLTHSFNFFPHFTGVLFVSKLFLPPTVYFYARSLTSPAEIWFEKYDVFALLAPIIAVIIALPYYGLTAQEKIALMSPLTRDPELYERALLGCMIGLSLFVFTAVYYLVLSFRKLNAHAVRLKTHFSRIDDKELSWLKFVLKVLVIAWIWFAISEYWLITGSQPKIVYLFTIIFELVWISLIAIKGVNQTPVYNQLSAESRRNFIAMNSEKEKVYSRSGLSDTEKSSISQKLQKVMIDEELYKDPELSLRTLSERLKVSEINISETFSQHMKTNFFDFVNKCRVAEACKLLTETDYKILSIGFEAGFNSRSTFNSAFKKLTGQTPSQYRQNAAKLLLRA